MTTGGATIKAALVAALTQVLGAQLHDGGLPNFGASASSGTRDALALASIIAAIS